MHREKIKEMVSSKTWQDLKTIIFMKLKSMRKLLTDYILLCIIPGASLETQYFKANFSIM